MSTFDLRIVPQNLSVTTETRKTHLKIHTPFSERAIIYQ